MDTILLALTPEFEMLRDELGYDEYEDFDAYDIMFQQGYDRQLIEVADGETFEGDDPDNEFYLLEDEADLLEKENFIADSLPSGNYRYDAAEDAFWKTDMDSDDSFL